MLIRPAITLMLLYTLSSICVSAQSSAFTYQGRLSDSGTQPTATYDMEFKLFDALEGGNQLPLGNPITITFTDPPRGVSVANGVFTVQLDFGGAAAFDGGPRWLQIAVKKTTDTSFVTLNPRQAITSTPYAITATNSTQLDGRAASDYVLTTDSRMTDARSPTAGSGDYIQNNTSSQAQASSFNISGNGTVGGNLTASGSVIANQLDTFGGGTLFIGTNRATGVQIGRSNIPISIIGGSVDISGQLQTTNLSASSVYSGNFDSPGTPNLSIAALHATTVSIGKPTTIFGLLTANDGISTNTETISGDLTVGGTINGTVANANNAASLGGVAASQYVQTTDPRMSDARAPTVGSVNYVQMNPASRQAGNFNMSGSGTIGTDLAVGAGLIVGGDGVFYGSLVASNSTLLTGTQPPPSSDSDGISAFDVLRVVGAKGGNTLGGFGGTGGNVLIQAGDGGDGGEGLAAGGRGGSITVQPGAGGNTSSFRAGNVLLAPSAGLVGIGTTSPQSSLQVFKEAGVDAVGGNLILNRFFTSAGGWRGASLFSYFPNAHGHDVLAFGVSEDFTAPNTIGAVKMVVSANGNVGIGTTAPDNMLTVNGLADKPGGGSWGTFSDERLKNIKGRFAPGLKAVMQLQPLRYEYKPDNALGIKSSGEHIGFSAQAVEKIVPEAVTKNDKGYRLVNNDPILWTMLNAVKEQQAEIVDHKTLIQSQQKLLETQQRQIEQQQRQVNALKRLVCSMKASADICKKEQ